MTVKKLIQALQDLPPNLEIVLAKDDEGNGYRTLEYIPSVMFGRKDGYEWEIRSEEDREAGDGTKKVVVLG